MLKLILLGIVILVLNIPFGYWRANVKRMSLQWLLAIHIPVIIIIAIRFMAGVGFAWYTYAVFVSAFFLGQQFGGLIIKRLAKVCYTVSSCMVMDMIRCRKAY